MASPTISGAVGVRGGARGDGGAAGSRQRARGALHHGPPHDVARPLDAWPCASHVHVHGASHSTLPPHARGDCENARMAGKASRGRSSPDRLCAQEHANDASVGLFMVDNSSCVTVCMVVSLVSLIISHSWSSARDWNRFKAVLDEPATELGGWAVACNPRLLPRGPRSTFDYIKHI